MSDVRLFDGYSLYNGVAKDADVVVSTRVRLARNLSDYPFSPRLDETGAREITEKVVSAAGDEYEYTDFEKLPFYVAMSLAERHIVSPEFAKQKNAHGLLASTEKGVYMMLLEEDHVRLQCLMAGSSLDEAYERAAEAEDMLDRKLNFAYSERFGYLTHCPTNLGTGMRASVMLFLPAISAAKQITPLRNQLAKMGLTVRGMSGEGSAGDGCLYQVSNQITLGISEAETVKKLSAVTDSIVKRERELREKMSADSHAVLRDSIRRAVGIMKYAELLDTKELFDLYAKIRLGISLGIVEGIDYGAIDGLLLTSMPAHITAEAGDAVNSPMERDAVRAAKARVLMAEV